MTEQANETQTQEQTTTEQTQTSLLGAQGEQTQTNDTHTQTTEETTITGAPESIDGYEVNVEGFNFDEFKAIEENQQFLERARESGLDNKALNFLLKEYNELIPALMESNTVLDNEKAVQTMTEVWGGEAGKNFGYANNAANNLIANGVLTAEEVNDPSFGNNPLVLKMAAYFGSQLQEDTPPGNTQQSGGVSIEQLMKDPAYSDASHPNHQSVARQVAEYFSKTSVD
ncbi:hypothetical protein [Acinetobacter schindleri]|uniref:hypothetical protein n=1 Tax=Acinetobacter schindleri TaxID=108981 RepID=UPI002FDE0FC7